MLWCWITWMINVLDFPLIKIALLYTELHSNLVSRIWTMQVVGLAKCINLYQLIIFTDIWKFLSISIYLLIFTLDFAALNVMSDMSVQAQNYSSKEFHIVYEKNSVVHL